MCPPTLSYQWMLDGIAIGGATGHYHTATKAGALSVMVTATNAHGVDSLESGAVGVVPASTPPNLIAVSVTPATGRVGDTFTASATATGEPAPGLSYQWAIDGTVLPGATAAQHLAEAVGVLSVTVAATNT